MSLRAHLIVLLLSGIVVTLQGCAGVVIAGGATAGAMANDSRTTGTQVDDEVIEWKIFEAITGNEALNKDTHLNATSYGGIVLLTGEVPSEQIRLEIDQKIKGIVGVKQLHDETTIGAPSSMMSRSGDTWITSKVKTAFLTEDTEIGSRTKVVTDKGVVYLMGIVTAQEADKLAEIARRVGGVQKVVKVFQYKS